MEDWPVIYSYSRADALGDGQLVDISQLAREAGFVFPVAITRAVYDKIVRPTDKARSELGQLVEPPCRSSPDLAGVVVP